MTRRAIAAIAGAVLAVAGAACEASPLEGDAVVDRAAVDAADASGRPPGSILVRRVLRGTPRADGALLEVGRGGEVTRVGRASCKRVHASVAGPALCLTRSYNGIDYDGVVLDEDYREVTRFPVEGVPDRARVSSDGRYGAYTSFDRSGSRGYFESTRDFTTYTRIVDMRDGRELLRLEELRVTRGGTPVPHAGAELWGVTFATAGRYFATLASDGEHLLIAGRVGSTRARVLRAGIECPAVSPDGTRIAYKRRIGALNRWRLHVERIDGTGAVALAESRSIDDQPEWLSDDRIAYSDDRATFAVPADGSGSPELLAALTTSPSRLAR